jgi:hypothetical protein
MLSRVGLLGSANFPYCVDVRQRFVQTCKLAEFETSAGFPDFLNIRIVGLPNTRIIHSIWQSCSFVDICSSSVVLVFWHASGCVADVCDSFQTNWQSDTVWFASFSFCQSIQNSYWKFQCDPFLLFGSKAVWELDGRSCKYLNVQTSTRQVCWTHFVSFV